MRLQYAQTDASVADIAAYAEDKASDIVLVKTLIPFGLTILGVVCLLGSGRDRHGPHAQARGRLSSGARAGQRRSHGADRPQRAADRHRRRHAEQRVDRRDAGLHRQ